MYGNKLYITMFGCVGNVIIIVYPTRLHDCLAFYTIVQPLTRSFSFLFDKLAFYMIVYHIMGSFSFIPSNDRLLLTRSTTDLLSIRSFNFLRDCLTKYFFKT